MKKIITLTLIIFSLACFGQAPPQKDSVYVSTGTGHGSKTMGFQGKVTHTGKSSVNIGKQETKGDTVLVTISETQLENLNVILKNRELLKVELQRSESEYQRAMLFLLGVPLEQLDYLSFNEKSNQFKLLTKKPK